MAYLKCQEIFFVEIEKIQLRL